MPDLEGVQKTIHDAITDWRMHHDPADDDGPTMAEHIAHRLDDEGHFWQPDPWPAFSVMFVDDQQTVYRMDNDTTLRFDDRTAAIALAVMEFSTEALRETIEQVEAERRG